MNSFELVFDTIEGDIVINMEYYNTKEGQCKEYNSVLFTSSLLLAQHNKCPYHNSYQLH